FSAATSFTLAPSEERTAIDVQLQLVPLVTVTGTVMTNQQTSPPSVQLIDRAQAPGQNTRSTRTASDGTFSFTGVPPGQYTVVARATVREASPPTSYAREVAPASPAAASAEAKMTAMAAAGLMAPSSSTGMNQLWATQDVSVDGRTRSSVMLSLQNGM